MLMKLRRSKFKGIKKELRNEGELKAIEIEKNQNQ